MGLGRLYWAMAQDLVWEWWEDPNYSHGSLVPLFSGFLIWQRREKLRALTPRGSWAGVLLLLVGIGALFLGHIGAENFLMRSSLIVILARLVLFHFGRETFRILLFPLTFLFFMVPPSANVREPDQHLPHTTIHTPRPPEGGISGYRSAWWSSSCSRL